MYKYMDDFMGTSSFIYFIYQNISFVTHQFRNDRLPIVWTLCKFANGRIQVFPLITHKMTWTGFDTCWRRCFVPNELCHHVFGLYPYTVPSVPFQNTSIVGSLTKRLMFYPVIAKIRLDYLDWKWVYWEIPAKIGCISCHILSLIRQ